MKKVRYIIEQVISQEFEIEVEETMDEDSTYNFIEQYCRDNMHELDNPQLVEEKLGVCDAEGLIDDWTTL